MITEQLCRPRTIFEVELQTLINKHSMEINSHTPDFILAQYMDMCLSAFNIATVKRDKWYNEVREKSTELNKEKP